MKKQSNENLLIREKILNSELFLNENGVTHFMNFDSNSFQRCLETKNEDPWQNI